MADLIFEWDPRKSRANFKKHKITFAEAESVFYDESGLLIEDPEHSEDEDRFLLLGLSATLRNSSCRIAIVRQAEPSGLFLPEKPNRESGNSTG